MLKLQHTRRSLLKMRLAGAGGQASTGKDSGTQAQ